MSIENEITKTESAVVNEIEKIEAPVVAKVDGLKTEVVTEVEKVAGLPKDTKETSWVAKEVKKVDIALKDADKLMYTELENAFLRTQLQLNEAVANIEKMRQNANKIIQGFIQSYGIDPTKHAFNEAEKVFKAL